MHVAFLTAELKCFVPSFPLRTPCPGARVAHNEVHGDKFHCFSILGSSEVQTGRCECVVFFFFLFFSLPFCMGNVGV